MNDFTLLDNAILAAIKAGKRRHQTICDDPDVVHHAEALVTPTTKYYRIVDRRTQALRKLGRITFTSFSGWSIPHV